MSGSPLSGRRIGITAARKAQPQIDMFERRGARTEWGPALSATPAVVDTEALEEVTRRVLHRPVDLVLATTGIGITTWFAHADRWGLGDALADAIGSTEVLARGPKSAAALRRRGIRENWSPTSECFGDVLSHLSARELSGTRIVLQEHGASLAAAADWLRRRGAEVDVVSIYRIHAAEDRRPLHRVITLAADRELDAVTFTSAPAIAVFMQAAGDIGRLDDLVGALRSGVVAACVGPVAADTFSFWEVPTVVPHRYRLAALVKLVESSLVLANSQ
ncbi:uroporphyrinogen-III synthase [Mycolicibacterium sp.]|uniref:uroporphyrinogen-III synthase n=1 Tax=Mycolicibacterium sp. TaxID=2320850 RepID=UPI003D0FDA1A